MSESATSPYATAAAHEEAAVGWVLHTLGRDDEVTFLVHLEGCPDCRRTVAEVSSVMSSVGSSVSTALVPEQPPARLHESLMAAVAAEPDPPRRATDETTSDDSAGSGDSGDSGGSGRSRSGGSADSAGSAGGATVIPMRSRARRLALVAAVAALVVVIGGLVASNRSLTEQRDAQTAASDRVTSLLRDAGRPGAVRATLADPAGGLVGLVVDTGSGPRVLTTGLAGNRPDQTYVLWSLVGTRPQAVGTFDVSDSAPSVRSVGSVDEAIRPEAYAVSIEPGRTAPASPTTIVAKGQVTG